VAASASPGVLVVGALRPREGTAAEQVVRALARDTSAAVLELDPLGTREVADLLGALLDAEPPADLVRDVVARTDGVPLLVEEVLDAHLRAGSVEVSDRGARWRGGGPVVPRTTRDMVDDRLRRLPGAQRDVIVAGAVLGDFDVRLLATVSGQGQRTAGDAIVAGGDVGLLESASGAVMFRHAVLRDAVLDATLPHVLASVHRRASDALAEGAARDPTRLERRAHHLAEIDEFDEAAVLLTEASTIQLAGHALLGAAASATAAGALARSPAVKAAARDALATALTAQGRWADATAVDEETNRVAGDSAARCLRMAACAVEAGQPDVAAPLLARAVALGDTSPAADVVAGRVALAAGEGDAGLRAAERALAAAERDGDLAAVCLALDLLGRALDLVGRRTEAAATWTRQAELASGAGLTDAHLRAVVQLAKLELFDGRPARRLYEACDLTRAAGALVEQAWAEENLAIGLTLQGDPASGAQLAEAAAARCRQLHIDALPYLTAAHAGAMSFLDRERALALLDEADALAPTTDVRMHTSGIRADVAIREGRYDDAVQLLEETVAAMRQLPGNMPSDSPYYLVLALCAARRADEAADALAYARSLPNVERWHGRPVVLAAAEALVAGSDAGIDAAIASATGQMPLDLAEIRVIAAEVLDTPARTRWLREALDAFEAAGAEVGAARARRLLRQAGGAVPRRRKADAALPEELARHGVTTREAEVLRLLGEGLSNAAIAERLYLSVRTVETHVSSLLAKLQAESRGQLTALSAALAVREDASLTS
jgi:DNA-binding CsgD family transcriptional regulator